MGVGGGRDGGGYRSTRTSSEVGTYAAEGTSGPSCLRVMHSIRTAPLIRRGPRETSRKLDGNNGNGPASRGRAGRGNLLLNETPCSLYCVSRNVSSWVC